MEQPIEAVADGSAADRVYESIKSMAISYAFRPGERINEVELARDLAVSRTPLREALNRLASEGFLTSVPNRGFSRRPLDPREIFNLYEFRAALEGSIVRIVCTRASDAELDELEHYIEASRQTGKDAKPVELLRLDEEFHVRLARLTNNDEFVRSLEGVNSRIHFARWIDMRTRQQVPGQHLNMVRCLKSRDPDLCEKTMRDQISRRYDQIVDVLKIAAAEIYLGTPD